MPTRAYACAVLATLLLAGCRDREITAYRAPKDAPPAVQPANADASANAQGMPADHPPIDSTNNQGLPAGHPPIGNAGAAPVQGADQSNMANTAVPTAGGSGLRWTAPTTWTPKAGSAMRKGSYAVKADGGEADLSITAFPGATGGLEANLARWRGQVGLPAVSSTEIVAAAEKFDSNGLSFVVVDYANNGTRLLGAIVPYQGNSWFFKLMGPDAVVAGQKAAFLEFLHTVKAPEL